MSSANSFSSLNVSQLILSDGKVSGTEFERVSSSTLKTEGNQIIQSKIYKLVFKFLVIVLQIYTTLMSVSIVAISHSR